jgi:Uncharacterized protein conserved in bacteria
VLNRPGANTNLGTLAAVRSKPDGYTLLIASIGLAANPSLYKKLAFEPQSDLEPITLIANSPTVLAVPPSLPVHSLAEFVAYVKARPGELNYGSYGVGSGPASRHRAVPGHDRHPDGACALWRRRPRRAGRDDQPGAGAFFERAPVLGMLRSGTLKAIASRPITAPSCSRTCRPSRKAGSTTRPAPGSACSLPPRTPPEIIGKLHGATVAILQDQAVRAKIVEQGADVIANSPAEFRAFIRDESARLAGVIRNSNIVLD